MSELRVQLHVLHDDGLSPVPFGEDAEAVVENDGGGGVGVEQRGVAAEERAVHTAEIAGDVLVDAALLEGGRTIRGKRVLGRTSERLLKRGGTSGDEGK